MPVHTRPAPLAVKPADGAALLGVSRQTIYRWMWAGEIRSVTLGSSRRIPMTEIDRLLTEGFPRKGPSTQTTKAAPASSETVPST